MCQIKYQNFRLMLNSTFDCVVQHVKNVKPSSDEQEKLLPWRQRRLNMAESCSLSAIILKTLW